ncbi:RING finger protein 207 isoform X5 [Siphateles boraxobius]|uniref:RING finger protein 207 isoform X5 n=1 Tax=Siphateles boraxobius TaxID=180520 RepID=UPI0040640A82
MAEMPVRSPFCCHITSVCCERNKCTSSRGSTPEVLVGQFSRQMWMQCIIATLVASHCVETAGKPPIRPRCFPATRLSPWQSAPKKPTKNVPSMRNSTSCFLQRKSPCSASTASETCKFLFHRENRAHCIDIETAYLQGCKKLDQAVLAVKELQTSAREAIILLKAMIGEVRTNVDEEESAICTLFNNMQEKLAERKKILLKAAQSQHEEKERAFKEQLSHLAALLPTLQVHLVTCSAFLSSANKFEFLDMGYQLMERLKKIVKLPHRLRPAQSSKINTEYRSEFVRCLEPVLLLGKRRSLSTTGNVALGLGNASGLMQSSLSVQCHSPAISEMSLCSSVVCRPTSHRYISTKVLLAEGGETPFMNHCCNYENSYRTLHTQIQKLKDQVQEIHRDLTKHHSLTKPDTMSEILERSVQVNEQISVEYSSVELMRAIFEEIWEETLQRVANEQEIYEAQLHDLLQLKQENSYLTTISRQIGPYIRSIAKVKERLEPRLKEPKELKDDRTEIMLKLYEDSTTTADTQPINELSCNTEEFWTPNSLSEETNPKNKEYYRPNKQKNTTDTANRKEIPM